ncbi:MAG TPA: hypothetical protein VN285_11975 [Candidatus Deferrimicrobium sp.]|nr:hypothetical protein [Candidatus Deferrimicrobium sp.]
MPQSASKSQTNESLYSLRLEQIFNNKWHEEYERFLDALWRQVIYLNSNVFIIKRITSHPWNLFTLKDNHFWLLTFYSMFDSSVMIVNRICLDAARDVLTIPKLKTEILKQIKGSRLAADFRKRLKEISFERNMKFAKSWLKERRDKRIAHFQYLNSPEKWAVDYQQLVRLAEDLPKICEIINSFFDALCFGGGRRKVLGDYGGDIIYPEDMDSRADITILLDWIAEHDPLLRMPEEQPKGWPYYRENLSADDLKTLNEYRKKFRLPEV